MTTESSKVMTTGSFSEELKEQQAAINKLLLQLDDKMGGRRAEDFRDNITELINQIHGNQCGERSQLAS
jgi:hypothetical protein